jgi:hypothetical protein
MSLASPSNIRWSTERHVHVNEETNYMTRISIIGATLILLAVGATASAQTSSAGGDQVNAETTACAYDLGFVCISTTGNLVEFERLPAVNLLNSAVEAYSLCDSAASRTTYGFGDFGWGAPTLLALSATSVYIERISTDGAFSLRQKWTRDTVERDTTVTSTIKNISGAIRTGVEFIRTIHVDASTTTYDASSNSAWMRNPLPSVGITSSALPPNNAATHAAYVSSSGIFLSGCDPAGVLATPGTQASGNISQPIYYTTPGGTLGVGKSLIVKHVYRTQ